MHDIFSNLVVNFFEGDDIALDAMCDYLRETSSPSEDYLDKMKHMFTRLRENPVARMNSVKFFPILNKEEF